MRKTVILKLIISRILLGAIFALSAIAKLFSMESFELYIFSFAFFGFDLSAILARVVVIVESLLGIGLMFNLFYKQVKWATAVSLCGFSAFLIWRAIIGDTESCHCMGDLVEMNPVQSLLKNLLLAAILAYSWNSTGRVFARQGLVSILCALAVLVTVFVVQPPAVYFRWNGHESNDLVVEKFSPVADTLGLSAGRRIVCFYSCSCVHCAKCATRMAGIIRGHSIPTDSVHVVFMQTHVNQDSVVTSFYHEHGDDMILPYSYISPFEFIPLTNGYMPLVTLFKDGELIREYDYLSLDEKELAAFFE